MVAGCPKCSARYRVDVDRVGPDGSKLRCTKCSAVFLVRVPKPSAAAPVEVSGAPPAAVVTGSTAPSSAGAQGAAVASEPKEGMDPARLVIIADPDEERGKASAEAVQSWGLIPHVVHDGVEAMLAIQRMLPSAVVLDASLPKMFGFQVCEVLKRNDSLRHIRVVLVGAIQHEARYRPGPSVLYGADVYIEQPDLPDGLLPILREAGLPLVDDVAGASKDSPPIVRGPAASAPVESVVEARSAQRVVPGVDPVLPPPQTPELNLDKTFLSPGPEPTFGTDVRVAEQATREVAEDQERSEERERARRLARIAVSEMVLYQPEKFEKAAREGTLEQALGLEIQEARALLRQRIGEEVRAETDFIIDELHRVTADRSR